MHIYIYIYIIIYIVIYLHLYNIYTHIYIYSVLHSMLINEASGHSIMHSKKMLSMSTILVGGSDLQKTPARGERDECRA